MCVAALVGYFAFPTYPDLRLLLRAAVGPRPAAPAPARLPRLPRPHRAPAGDRLRHGLLDLRPGRRAADGARLDRLLRGARRRLLPAGAAVLRPGRGRCSPALLVLSRFFVENLAAQGYLDISYVALIVWAIGLEVERPRRGAPVFVLLAAAGLLRPDAWVLSGVYWLWCACRAAPTTARACAISASPRSRRVVWVGVDAVVTGNPLYSLHSTSGLAAELGRTQGSARCSPRCGRYGGAHRQAAGAARRARRGCRSRSGSRRAACSCRWPRCAVLLGVFLAEGAAGASVVDRYLLGAAIVLLLFCAVAIGGWSMLEPGHGAAARVDASAPPRWSCLRRRRRPPRTLSLDSLRTTLAYHEDFHKGLAAALAQPARASAQLRALPAAVAAQQQADPRRALDPRQRRPARHRRAQPGARRRGRGRTQLEDRIRQGSVAVYPLGSAVFFEAIVDVGDDPRDQVPAARLQPHLHEPLLRGLCELLRQPRAGCARRPPRRTRRGGARGRRAPVGVGRARARPRGGLALRLWGVRQGLPYAYNTDEADHFVPHAVAMFAARPEPALLRQPAGVHVPAALVLRARLRRRRRASRTRSRAHPDRRVHARARRRRGARHGARCGCCTSSARACSAAASGCSRRRSRRSRSCPSSTRTSRSTTCPRSRR